MLELIVSTGQPGKYIEVDKAYDYAIRTGAFEFDGYHVISADDRYREGYKHAPFSVSAAQDIEAPADFVTVTGGRYNKAQASTTDLLSSH